VTDLARRPYVLASVAASIDGYIDDATPDRLLLSNDADFDRVDAVRATVDAILVGGATIRADNPRLMVRSEERRQARVAAGKPETPIKVTITRSKLDPSAKFFTTGDEKIVYTPSSSAAEIAGHLEGAATVVDAGDPLDVHQLLADLADRGVERLMIEGGGHIHTMFLAADVVDEVHLVIAPFLIGNPAAPSFTLPAAYPQNPARPFRLDGAETIGEVVLLRYRRPDPA
jgi:5-amino-6-(5-phosphoribosylamino)uracil reductase